MRATTQRARQEADKTGRVAVRRWHRPGRAWVGLVVLGGGVLLAARWAPTPAVSDVAPAAFARTDTVGLSRVTLINGHPDSLVVEVRTSGVDSTGAVTDGGDCGAGTVVGQATLGPAQRWSVVSAGAICWRTARVGRGVPRWSAWERRVLPSGTRVRAQL
jgi:hypothetical protein